LKILGQSFFFRAADMPTALPNTVETARKFGSCELVISLLAKNEIDALRVDDSYLLERALRDVDEKS